MSISDGDYLDWLQTQNVMRGVLVEYSSLNSGVLESGYAANCAFVSFPSDTPANIAYDDSIVGEINFRRSASDSFDGGASVSRGEVTLLLNDDTQGLIYNWFNLQPLNIFMGSPDWEKDDFRKIVSGVVKNKSIQQNNLILVFRDESEIINTPFSRTAISGGVADGKNIPLCFGECFNVSPLLIDSATSKYQVHDGAIEAITQVRDNGVSVAFTANLTTGTFTLTSAAAGQITCDVKGSKPASGIVTGYKVKAVDLVRLIISNYSNFDESKIDDTAFTALDTLAPYNCGLYIQSDTFTILEAIDQLLKSIGAFWLITRLGEFSIGRISLPSSGDNFLYRDEIENFGVTVKKVIDPKISVRLGYRKNWTEQKSGLAGAVTESNRLLYGAKYSISLSEDLSVLTNYPDAIASPEIETLLVEKTDCDDEADRRMGLASEARTVFEINALTASFSLNIGDSVDVFYDKYGMQDGESLVIVGITEKIGYGSSVIEAWK